MPTHKTKKPWEAAYETMLHRVKEASEHWQEKNGQQMVEYIRHAKEKAISLSELSEHEAEKIASYLQRDMNEAAKFMLKAQKLFRESLYFDWKVIEDKLYNACSQVADKTMLELQQFKQQLTMRDVIYRAGEVAGPVSLKCTKCGHHVLIDNVREIPCCPVCQHTDFIRLTSADKAAPKPSQQENNGDAK